MKPFSANPRSITDRALRRLRDNLADLGDLGGVVFDQNSGQIVGGHMRLRSMFGESAGEFNVQDADIELIAEYDPPTAQGTIAEGFLRWRGGRYSFRKVRWDEATFRRANFVANQPAGDWDWSTFANTISAADLQAWGVDPGEWLSQLSIDVGAVRNMIEAEKVVGDAESQIGGGEALEKWNVKEGDLFKLDSHKLLCGDSTRRENIERLIAGQRYCVLTDPPYNVKFKYNDMDDEMPAQEYADFCRAWFEVVNDAECQIFSPGPKNTRLYPIPRDTGYWLKRNASAGASVFNLRTIEPLFIYGKIGKKRNFDLFDYSSGFPEELRAAQRAALVEEVHPPAKPIGLWIDLLNILPLGLPVVDCFSGNGTTFVACHNKGRICYGIERDPSYCALILERMSQAFPGLLIERIK